MQTTRARLAISLQRAFEEVTGSPVDLPRIEDPPRREMGDLACTAALQIAKEIGTNPRELGQKVADAVEAAGLTGVSEISIAGPGFINLRLDRAALLGALVEDLAGAPSPQDAKVLVEHTSINPNKAAHIGHLRNACMGDTLARIYRALGYPVEVHNYIDDTGVQVADVVIGFLDLRGDTPESVGELPEPFDYLCWDLYTEVSDRLTSDEDLQARRRDVLLALEHGDGVEAKMGQVVAERIVRRHIRTMARLGIRYDVLVKEGDILRLDLWSEAFERLKSSPQVRLVEDGKHAGCWVMHLTGIKGFENLEEADKVLVRSNGVATYVAKDIAYHFWKYGLLDRDFTYSPVEGVGDLGDPPFETSGRDGIEHDFGNADRAVTVIDVRQSYLQAVVAQAFRVTDHAAEGDTLTHFSYEMVALTPRTADQLGIPVDADDRDKSFVEMSGRRGYGVKADDLMDELGRRAAEEVGERNPGMDDAGRTQAGVEIAIAAVRYFLLKYARNTVIAFDMDDALSFEGETGPYIQYAAVRAAHIFDKLGSELEMDVNQVVSEALGGGQDPLGIRSPEVGTRLANDDGELWDLILALGRYEEAVQLAADTLEISALAKYAFHLAQQFNRFYHGYPILQATDDADRALRVLVAYAFQKRLADVLDVLGIPVPNRM
ncbi:MAG: arginine--tRNA ligase [Acidobacteria bacterium]|nr:arginine--tRNA ligase [Acidobacteriota bacterium]